MARTHISFYAGVYFPGARAFETGGVVLPPTFEVGGVRFHLAKRDEWSVYECAWVSIGEVMRLQRLFDGAGERNV